MIIITWLFLTSYGFSDWSLWNKIDSLINARCNFVEDDDGKQAHAMVWDSSSLMTF